MANDYCDWKLDDHTGSYDTECKNKFEFIDGTPQDNKFTFCPYCGLRIWDVSEQQSEEE